MKEDKKLCQKRVKSESAFCLGPTIEKTNSEEGLGVKGVARVRGST